MNKKRCKLTKIIVRRNSNFMKFTEETQYQPDHCSIFSKSFNHLKWLNTSAWTAEQIKGKKSIKKTVLYFTDAKISFTVQEIKEAQEETQRREIYKTFIIKF